jgi:hypothetical protein
LTRGRSLPWVCPTGSARQLFERKPERLHRYCAFVDPSGGSNDSMTLAVAHREGDTVILDALRERVPPFGPEQVVEEFADTLKRYRITKVHGDRYAGEWPREQFRKYGITYSPSERAPRAIFISICCR